MAIEERELALRRMLSLMRDLADIDRGNQTASVSTAFTMDEDRLLRGTHKRDKFFRLRETEDMAGRHAEVVMRHPHLLRHGQFVAVPCLAWIRAAQIDDGPYPVIADITAEFARRRLGERYN